ncbi:MAG: hypothetical protein A2139_11700 [Desulfobacca sp. RBG_16_60_12]|nr:MAG: hypothetical protein A2139_11700 [Desulfobacca sp. RBG_16_60_12]
MKHRLLNLKAAAVLLLIIFMLYCLSSTAADPDLWGYLAFGRLFWGQGQFPYEDVFAYVPTLKPWIYHEWLTGVLFYPLYRTLGPPGLQVLKYALALAAVGAVYLTARRRGADLWPTALLILFALSCLRLGYSPVRAQVFTYFGFAVFLYLLEDARLSGRWGKLWLLAPIQIVWCNLHGGFLAGLGLIFLYAVGEAWSRRPFRPYLVWFLVAGLATLINPYGLKYWSYLAQAVTMPRPEITEWVSIVEGYKQGFVGGYEFYYFLALMAVAVLLACWARWREVTPAMVLLFTLYLAVRHSRHQVFFALAFVAYLPLLLSKYFRELTTRPGFMAAIDRLGRKIPALAVLLLICLFTYRLAGHNPLKLEVPSEPSRASRPPPYYPVGAVDYLEPRHLGKKLLVHFDWGEYCLWRLYPQCLVAIDGRYETVYPEAVHKEYFDFLMGRKGWRNFLAHYPPDLILIGMGSRIYGLLSADPQWRQVYADTGCALFRRRDQVPAGPAQAPRQP